MDSIDYKLLELLQTDCQMPMNELASTVNLSSPACYRRVKNLRDAGVIEKETAVVKPKTMGWPIRMLVLVKLETDKPSTMKAFVDRVNQSVEVTDSWTVTGDHDFVLNVIARDMEDYDEFTERVLHKDDTVKSFKTLVILKQSKASGAIPCAF